MANPSVLFAETFTAPHTLQLHIAQIVVAAMVDISCNR